MSRRDLAAAREFAAEHGGAGCAAYADPAELLADPRVEPVIIATPGDSHCEYTLLAAAHGSPHVRGCATRAGAVAASGRATAV